MINYLFLSFDVFPALRQVRKHATNAPKKIVRTYHELTVRGIRNLQQIVQFSIDHQNIEKLRTTSLGKPSGKSIEKHKFDYRKIGTLAQQYPSRKSFEQKLGTVYEVARRTGYLTEDAMEKTIASLQGQSQLLLELTEATSRNLMWLEVIKKREIQYTGTLVDLSVPELENFVGGFGGIYLHNTLSAFLAIINDLIILEEAGTLEDKVYCVYISPLKALANDITKNLKEPLKEIKELAKQQKKKINIRVGTRTGDTTPSQKAGMLKKPPHIMITTPESLAICLTTIKFRELLKPIKFCIIDEIHSLAENKRGVHLSLSMERLQALVEEYQAEQEQQPGLVRIGLSATVSPLEEVAKFLVGLEYPQENVYRDCHIVDVQALKKMDVKVLCPVPDIMRASHTKTQDAMYAMIHDLIQTHKTTLVFTNTRAGTERVVHQLKNRYPKEYLSFLDGDKEEAELEEETEREMSAIGAHHGSLSKTHRLNIENRLKQGKLRAVVCSTSLELGIDIGTIDLVILLGSPKSVARGLQRIGRSGHKLDEIAKGRIIVLDRDDMVECSVLLKAAIEKKIDTLHLPKNCLDVLAQQLFGMAIEKIRSFEETFFLIRRSHTYHSITREDFTEVVKYLAGEYVSLEQRSVYAKIWYDQETGMIGKRGKLARLIYLTNVGTIPDETNVKVKIGEQIIGTIDEGFLERLQPGDVFVLGGETYEFRFSRGMTAQVKTSAGRPPTVPSWVSESLPLSFDLSNEIQLFRQYMDELFQAKRSKAKIKEYIDEYLYADARTLESTYHYFHEQHNYAELPHKKNLLLEHYRDGNKRYVIVHSLYGRRVNDVLSRALAFALGKIHKRDVEVNISDNGFTLRSTVPLNVLKAFKLLKAKELPKVMHAALAKSEVLNRRFRHCAGRSLMILRTYKGNSKSVGKQQMSSRLLLNAVKRISEDFPILKEARREVLEDVMDINNAMEVLTAVEKKQIKINEITTSIPSPFAFNIVLQGYSDILKIEEKKEFLQRMHQQILQQIKGEKQEFSYEEHFTNTLQQRRAEKDDAEEELKHLIWNVEAPVFVKEGLIKMIEENKLPTRVEEALRKRLDKIRAHWPIPLQKKLYDELHIEYDPAELASDEEKILLKEQFQRAAKKLRLDPELVHLGYTLIDGELVENPEFWEFVHQQMSGTISKIWKDKITKFLQDQHAEYLNKQ